MKSIAPLMLVGIVILFGATSRLFGFNHKDSEAIGQMQSAHIEAAGHSPLVLAEAGADTTKKDSGGNTGEKKADAKKKPASISSDKPDLGIGPIKTIKLDSINADLVDAGKLLFTQKCTVCHQLDTKKVGPPLRDVAKRDTPEFIMNMVMNPIEMEQKNATVKKLIGQYQTYMSISGITQPQARSLLEYLRWAAEQHP